MESGVNVLADVYENKSPSTNTRLYVMPFPSTKVY